MTKFMSAKEALSMSNKNKEKRVEYYLDNIESNEKVNKIKKDIEKAVLNGEKWCRTFFWRDSSVEERTAILKYFTGLGYDISCHTGVYYIDFVQLHPTPRP